MIADTERLIDGFRGLPAGMDGSKEPPQTPSEAAWYATNVTFRGGNGPRTRPGFREIPPAYWRNPQPVKSVSSITIAGGIATVTTSTNHEYDNLDKVTIAGASPAGVNGTFTVTVTGNTTFTYLTTATGTVTGTITARRDVDLAYGDDFVDSSTSRTRYANDILGATYVQGVAIYQSPQDQNPTEMIVVADGKIMALNFNEASVKRLNLLDGISDDVPVYMTQAENFLIIQTGKDEPRIYDGYMLRRASFYGSQVVPIGKQMAYGQGRLFVAVNDGTEIAAGDLAFGGSLTSVAITDSTAANPTEITTALPHNFVVGDQVTIEGHSSEPTINSTYTIETTSSTTKLTIAKIVTSSGSGGYVKKANAGQANDLLLFTETTYLNEGGYLAPTGRVGRITGLTFLPIQDTATGQGDLIAFCERGAVTFQVSAPREEWKNTQGFQRILFDNIGSTSDSILPVNGDLFFRSKDGNGIRTYRNARAESDSYGQTPISAEINPVLKQDTLWMLDQVSMVTFDNRLLMTCLPKKFPRRAANQAQADQYAEESVPTLYEGIAVLDFQSVSSARGKSSAVFDGVWTGLRIVKLVQGDFDGDPRCFAVCFHEDDVGRRVEIWEITKNDEYDTPVEGQRRINAGIVTKAFNLGDDMSLKKLIRCDLWFDDLGGGLDYPFECELAYRPDDYPNFTTWQRFERAFQTDFLLEDRNLLTYSSNFENAAWTKTNCTTLPNSILAPYGDTFASKVIENSSSGDHALIQGRALGNVTKTLSVFLKAAERHLAYIDMSDNVTSVIRVYVNLATGSIFSQQLAASPWTDGSADIVNLGDGWYRVIISGTSGQGTFKTARIGLLPSVTTNTSYQGDGSSGVYIWGAQLELGNAATSYDADPPQLLNYERGYAPQVRFPAPPRTANLATDVPAYLGHDFTLRVNWSGRAHLGRLMLHGNRLTEAVNGGTL